MRRPVAVDAEIAGRPHDAFAEVMLPQAIHHHARRQRIRGRGDPLGQSQPPSRASAGKRNLGRLLAARYRLQKSGLHALTPARKLAARQNVSRRQIRNVWRHHVRHRVSHRTVARPQAREPGARRSVAAFHAAFCSSVNERVFRILQRGHEVAARLGFAGLLRVLRVAGRGSFVFGAVLRPQIRSPFCAAISSASSA